MCEVGFIININEEYNDFYNNFNVS